jgi:hypothetical protein
MRFLDVLGRTVRSELGQMEAADLPGVSERTFRRWRDRHREEGGRDYWTATGRRRCGVREVVARHGLFCSLYTDRCSHYCETPQAGGPLSKTVLTQFGRALKQVGIEHIAAHSPQARGRFERMFDTLQDRPPKELALAGISTVGRPIGGSRTAISPSTTSGLPSRRSSRARRSSSMRPRLGARSCARRRTGRWATTTR